MLQDYWEHHVPMVEEVSGYPQWLAGGSEDQAHWRDGQLHFWFPGNDLDVRLLSQQGGFVYGALPKQGAIFESSAPETTSTEKRLHSSLNVKFVGLDEVSSNLEEQVAISFVIPKAIRQELFTRLDKGFGINEKQMFPGFDGFIESIRSAQTPIHMRYGASYPCC
jgi:hypothetical protein